MCVATTCPGNDVKLIRCVLGRTLNSSVVVQGMTVKLRPCLHFRACRWGRFRWKAPCRKGCGWFVKLTWLALLSLYYILYGASRWQCYQTRLLLLLLLLLLLTEFDFHILLPIIKKNLNSLQYTIVSIIILQQRLSVIVYLRHYFEWNYKITLFLIEILIEISWRMNTFNRRPKCHCLHTCKLGLPRIMT